MNNFLLSKNIFLNRYLGPPVLLPQASNLVTFDVNENDPIELHCPVTITPDLSVQWSKNNEDLDSMWSTSNLSIRRFLLKIYRAHLSDAGLYKCNVVNGFGSVYAQFRVNVKCKWLLIFVSFIYSRKDYFS
jgi:hypothetical protein